jgi:hypothetical protein
MIDINAELNKIEMIEDKAKSAASEAAATRFFNQANKKREELQNRVLSETGLDTVFANAIKKQRQTASRRVTRSVNGKYQQRSCGPRAVRNCFGHAAGTIGETIDNLIINGLNNRLSPGEAAAICGTKRTKIYSHTANELNKKFGIVFSINEKTGKIEFTVPYKTGLIIDRYRKQVGLAS